AWVAAGKQAYRTFMRAMLDITDNQKKIDGKLSIITRDNIIRHDDVDSYLVVAADKGTAGFSDTANEIAAEYDHWLGDAFASGGSVGYDHKGMGITARGAFESVKSHFSALGIDVTSEPFTVVGIGDMSGDVFGNGMRRSRHTKLVAAFTTYIFSSTQIQNRMPPLMNANVYTTRHGQPGVTTTHRCFRTVVVFSIDQHVRYQSVKKCVGYLIWETTLPN